MSEPDVVALIGKLESVLIDRAAIFSTVGGEVGLLIIAEQPHWFTIRQTAQGELRIEEGKATKPIVSVGFQIDTFSELLEGTLDVEGAFRDKRLAVEGDRSALGRFVQCFIAQKSVIGIRRK